MRAFVAVTAGLAVLGAGLLTTPAHAQSKAPLPAPETKTITPVQFNEMVGDSTQADWREGYKHGRFLLLTLKNNNKVSGRVVFADPAANKLYVRPHDGDAPIAIPFADISKAERVQLASILAKKDGGVAPAIVGQPKAAPDTPEIISVRIANGDVYTEQLYSNVVSHPEQGALNKISAAEREVANARELIEKLNAILESKQQLQQTIVAQEQAMRTYLQLINNTARNYYFVGWWNPDPPLGIHASTYVPFGGWGYGHGYGGWGGGYAPTAALAYPVVTRIQDQGDTFTPGKIVEDIEVARKSLDKAEAELAMARSRAVYEDGRIVAVRLD